MKIYSHETHTQRSKQEVLKEEAMTPPEHAATYRH